MTPKKHEELVGRILRMSEIIRQDQARIKRLEATLKKWDALIKHQYTGSSEAMSDMHTCAQETAKLLYGVARAALNGEKGND